MFDEVLGKTTILAAQTYSTTLHN